MSYKSRMAGALADVVGASKGAATGPASTLPIDALRPGASQPRRYFDGKKMQELVASVKERGVLQPLLVRPTDTGYEIVAGERRWRAAKEAGLRDVPVLIRTLTDEEARYASLGENLLRDDLAPFDEIEGKLNLVALVLGVTPERAANRLNELVRNPDPETVETLTAVFSQLGRESWESYARNKLAVFGWPTPILAAMRQGLEFTKAKLINSAPAEMQGDLIAAALQGASRSELQAGIEQNRRPTKKPINEYDQAAKLLRNRRKMAKLPPETTERVQQLTRELLDLLEDL